jgi:hypothetical protein
MSDYDGPVRDYLAYCKRAAAELKLQGSSLDPKYHPTEAGCLKLVYYRTPAEAQEIRRAFRELTAGHAPGASGTTETTDNRRNQ